MHRVARFRPVNVEIMYVNRVRKDVKLIHCSSCAGKFVPATNGQSLCNDCSRNKPDDRTLTVPIGEHV